MSKKPAALNVSWLSFCCQLTWNTLASKWLLARRTLWYIRFLHQIHILDSTLQSLLLTLDSLPLSTF